MLAQLLNRGDELRQWQFRQSIENFKDFEE